MPEEKESDKASTTQWILMGSTAVFFDLLKLLLQFIPFIGQIMAIAVGWFAFATFWLWFKMLGAKYSRKTMIIGFISDFIPFLDVFSETATILALYLQSKVEKGISKVPGGKMALGAVVQKGEQAKANQERIKNELANLNKTPTKA